MSEDNATATPVDFWFDPRCPWAWVTARWMKEVEKVRPVEIRWRVMSLAVLNENRLDELPEQFRRWDTVGRYPVRICVAAEQKYGSKVLGPLYTALGTRIHNLGQKQTRETFAAALADAGLSEDLADAAYSTDYDTLIRTSHHEGITLVGQEIGTPIIAVPGPDDTRVAFFGPVVTPAPKGEAAARLWDGILLLAGTPGFFELKRSRDTEPSFD
ncbi:DsbA family protein [Nocardia sp. NPDC060256]|uniref:mycothiol-dependent nitroreductase Rv2466c family protein n=1 Tax=unclassified Nocardia TaxID=2637762 RepID=UPI003646FB02